MKEIKLIIDGKEVRLTDEQLKLLELEARKNPFDRAGKYEGYYCIKETGEIYTYYDDRGSFDNVLYAESNYFNDKDFANQVALHQLLYRKLLKYAYDNKCEDTAEWNGMLNYTYDNTCENTAEWSKRKQHYSVRYSYEDSTFVVFCQYDNKGQDVYFHQKKLQNGLSKK